MNKLLSYFITLSLIPGLVFGQTATTLDSSFQTPTNLTDKQMTDAKEFIHQGVKDRVVKEGCEKLNNCQDSDDGVILEQVIGKAYALFGVMSGGGIVPQLTKASGTSAAAKTTTSGTTNTAGNPPTTNAPTAPAADGAKPSADKDSQPDYCMMVAMGYETVGGMIQTSLQKKAENSAMKVNDAQLQSLISLKEMHKARRTTATMQSTIYGGVTACYAAMAYTKTIELDWKFWAKAGGAAALTALYLKKRDKHAKAMDKVQKVIDSLPKTGDCNPWTGTSCFCSEPTSKDVYPSQYQEVCVLNNGNFAATTQNVGCAAVTSTNKLQFDESCECKKTNTCMKTNFKGISVKVPAVANLMQEANKGFDLLNTGTFDEGKLVKYSTDAAAFGANFKPKTPVKATTPTNLDKDEAKIADALKPYMSESLANAAADSSGGYKGGISEPSTGSAAVSKLSPEIKAKLSEAVSVGYQQGSGNMTGTSNEPEFTMPGFPTQEAASNGTEVVSFAEQAVNKADVSNAPDTPIFDIISNRYRRSGWDKLNSLEK